MATFWRPLHVPPRRTHAPTNAALPSLATGLDVNVRFRHALDFEFTAELAIFDLLDVTPKLVRRVTQASGPLV